MDNLSECNNLFREAVKSTNIKFFQEHPDTKTKQVIRACKKVSDLLPFSEKISPLAKDLHLIKNLFIASEICSITAELILESLLE